MGVRGRKKIKEIKKALRAVRRRAQKKWRSPLSLSVADSGEEKEEGGGKKLATVLGNWGLPFLGNGGRNWRERKTQGGSAKGSFWGRERRVGGKKMREKKMKIKMKNPK